MSFQSKQHAFREGLKIGVPSLFGIGAWGLVVGVAMIKAGLTVPQAIGMTLLVFAGSAQLASLPLIAVHAPIWVIFATALVVNLRFVIFSAILAPHFSSLPLRVRAYLGYFSGDVSVAFFMLRFPHSDVQEEVSSEQSVVTLENKLAYLKGLIMPNWSAWQIGSLIGILPGSQVPMSWGLGFAGTLAILCIMLPLVMNKAALAGVVVASVVALVSVNFPYKLGLLIAVIVGMITAMVVEEWLESLHKTDAETDTKTDIKAEIQPSAAAQSVATNEEKR